MAQRPSTPKGTRDLLPEQVARRNYIFDTIRHSFEKYGFAPIETPSFEYSSTLMGKYGDEGDRLIFRILNSGEKLLKADKMALEERNIPRFANSLSEKALRYDLTVPFARFVVQHQNDLPFPFKRYQIQPVWRADRPQKGRYQEFYQCDADVVGSDSLLFEVDFVQLFDEVLTRLKVPDFTIKINNRKVLSGIAEVCGEEDRIIDITVAIDKLDKIGKEGVIKELQDKGVSEEAVNRIEPLFDIDGSTVERMNRMEEYLRESEIGKKGIEELRYIFDRCESLGVNPNRLEFDVTLARGLNYYTGAIFEVKANGVQIGSICGGGRYDDLTGTFGMKGVSGVGISFGADRIYDVLTELELFPETVSNALEIMFINFGSEGEAEVLGMIRDLRNAGFSAELYPSNAKMNKQMKYANARNVKVVIFCGSEELDSGEVQLKNMLTGEQSRVKLDSLIDYFKS